MTTILLHKVSQILLVDANVTTHSKVGPHAKQWEIYAIAFNVYKNQLYTLTMPSYGCYALLFVITLGSDMENSIHYT